MLGVPGIHASTRLRLRSTCSAATLCGLLALAPVSAYAQEAPAPQEDADGIDEIVVTAEKRAQNLQEVPAAISAFTGDRIESSGIRNIVDVQFLAAGLSFGQDRNGSVQTSIRGVSSNVGVESAVATHLDGVYLANRFDQIGAFFDVERVEVLRGPQGTLYGRNATGGAINIITREPTRTPEGFGQVTIGNYGLVEAEGYASGPLIGESVRGRISFKATDLAGYGENLIDGSDVNGRSSVSARLKLDIDASDDVRIRLSGDYTRLKASLANEISRVFPQVPLQVETMGFELGRRYDSNRNQANGQDVKASGGSARIDWDLGPVVLTSLTGYRHVDANTPFDIDGAPIDIAYFQFNRSESSQFTQELNLASDTSGPLRWLLGAYFLDNDLKGTFKVPIPALGLEILSNLITYRTKAYAAFAEGTYAITPSVSLTVGGRYSEENSHDLETRQLAPFLPAGTQDLRNKSSALTPRVSVRWEPSENINLYATYSKGFKSGGLNPLAFDGSNFAPEKVTNYEVGLKSLLFDRNLLLNVSAFNMDYTDLQVSTFIIVPPGFPLVRIVNAASARIYGIEADFQAQVGGELSLDGNLALLNAKYKDFESAVDPIGATTFPYDRPIGPFFRGASGNQMARAPRTSINLGANYKFPDVGGWTPTLRGEYSYQSRVYFTPFEDLRNLSQSPVGIFNARLEFKNESDGWTAAIWGRNLTNELVASDKNEITASQGSFREATYRPPFTFGLTLGKLF